MTTPYPYPGSHAERPPLPPGEQVALSDLAASYGCSTTNLRQRIERGTLQATKVGKQWIVARAEAERLLAER